MLGLESKKAMGWGTRNDWCCWSDEVANIKQAITKRVYAAGTHSFLGVYT